MTEGAQVEAAVAAALGVREQVSRPMGEVLAEALSGQDLLVLMDNCEHVVGPAAEVVALLNRRSPRLPRPGHIARTARRRSERLFSWGRSRCHPPTLVL